MINCFTVLSHTLYYDDRVARFSFEKQELSSEDSCIDIPDLVDLAKNYLPKVFSFCLDISDACNLNCDYCFNIHKTSKRMNYETAESFLNQMFTLFPTGDKYFIDLSGKGEPLLNLKLIMEISHYCHKKSNELRVEVLPSFVCNGTLLSKTIAEALQKEGILFGVSLDGLQYDNDHHRKGKDYKSVFDEVLKNIVPLSNKKYIGIAGTITKDVIDLDRTITHLSSSFSTISFRPVRSEIFGLDEKSEFLWEREYDHLATHLITDLLSGNLKLFYCLMNGEDFFGRFLCREFGEMRTINRCDAGITRFACNLDGSIYPCPSCSCIPSMKMGNALSKEAQKNLVAQAIQCKECRWKMICGGECQIEYLRKNKTNNVLCKLKIHLILLAALISLIAERDNKDSFEKLSAFVQVKNKRYQRNPGLDAFLKENPSLSFIDAKRIWDARHPLY